MPATIDEDQDLLIANFNFDYETKFSDLGIDIDASFSTGSSTSTYIYGGNTGRAGFTDLDDFTISSEDLTNYLFSNETKTLEENEIAIIKNKDEITNEINQFFEKLILNDPKQWIWTHNRWK